MGGGAGTSKDVDKKTQPKFSTVPPPPPNPTDNWRETDKKQHEQILQDKTSFAQGNRRVVAGSASVPTDLASAMAMSGGGGGGGGVGVVTVELTVLIESQSAPQLSGQVPVHHRPFDPNLLPEEKSPDYSKYKQCPHCGRKFDPVAAERHIPQCEQYYFNKDEKDAFKKTKPKPSSAK